MGSFPAAAGYQLHVNRWRCSPVLTCCEWVLDKRVFARFTHMLLLYNNNKHAFGDGWHEIWFIRHCCTYDITINMSTISREKIFQWNFRIISVTVIAWEKIDTSPGWDRFARRLVRSSILVDHPYKHSVKDNMCQKGNKQNVICVTITSVLCPRLGLLSVCITRNEPVTLTLIFLFHLW